MSVYFTACPHYGDPNIIKNANRPFKNLREMDLKMMINHNSIINNDDTVYIIGDYSPLSYQDINYLQSITKNLNGKKILILGNHDVLKPFTYINDLGFWSVHTSLEININNIDLVLCHDVSVSCMFRTRSFISGHVHDLFKIQKNVINVCVEVWNYKPVSFEELEPYLIK